VSRKLDDLAPVFRPLAVELIARIAEHGIAVLIVCTARTATEQADAVRRGVSRVARSKHQDGLAIDLVPYSEFRLHGPDKVQWDPLDPAWKIMGAIGESLGLRWGGRWKVPHDPGHFEYVDPAKGVPA
jgi:hypothetical protein